MSDKELQDLLEWLRQYASKRINSLLMDERRCVPPYIALDFGNHGLLGLMVEPSLGGLGLSTSQMVRVMEQLGAIDITLAIWVGIHNGLGIRPIDKFAVDSIRSELLPQLASGRMLGALAITERVAGSNVRMIQTSSLKSPDGWLVSGAKTWIGNGSWANVINVFARRSPKEGGGMNAFTVLADNPGLRIGPEAMTYGMRAIVQNEIFLDNALVPNEYVLGVAGDGFSVADDAFCLARLGICAIALGALRRCAQLGHRYASKRSISTGLLKDNERTLVVFEEIVFAIVAIEELVRATAADADRNGGVAPHMAAACKILGPELLGTGVDLMIQMLGGRGFLDSNILPMLARDARLLRIFEGPTETMEYHLGAGYLYDVITIESLFSGVMEAPTTLKEVNRHLDAWREKVAVMGLSSATSKYAWRLGNVLGWAILAASAEQSARITRSKLSQDAFEWARRKLELKAQAVIDAVAEPVLPNAGVVEAAIDSYLSKIGNVTQTLPGMDYSTDPLLIQ